MSDLRSKYRLEITGHFDELRRDFDLEAERRLATVGNDSLEQSEEYDAVEVGKRRDALLNELEAAEAANLKHLNEMSDEDVNEIAKLDELSRGERLFVVFCMPYMRNRDKLQLAVCKDGAYFSREQLEIVKEIYDYMFSVGSIISSVNVYDNEYKENRKKGNKKLFPKLFQDFSVDEDLTYIVIDVTRLASTQPDSFIYPVTKSELFKVECITLAHVQVRSLRPEAAKLFANMDDLKIVADLEIGQIFGQIENTNQLGATAAAFPATTNLRVELLPWEQQVVATTYTIVRLDSLLDQLRPFKLTYLQVGLPLYMTEAHQQLRLDISGTDLFAGLSHLKHLELSGFVLPCIKSNSFAQLTALETLDLDNNGIEEVEGHAFAGLSNLIDLTLRNNRIEWLDDEDTFEGLANLKYLHMVGNPICDSDSFDRNKHVRVQKHLTSLIAIYKKYREYTQRRSDS